MNHLEQMLLSLRGLSVGDAFGQCFFDDADVVKERIQTHTLPPPIWYVTDDTLMAISVAEMLAERGEILQDELAQKFAARYLNQPDRGYGGTAQRILRKISEGHDWRVVAREVFDGMGSMGNGAAMRVPVLGAFFAPDFERVKAQALLSAAVTHAHPDAQAGAVAVAIAAAYSARHAAQSTLAGFDANDYFEAILVHTPSGETHAKIQLAQRLPLSYSISTAVAALGNGNHLLSSDTVPLALWCAARHMNDYEEAIWNTVSALGDRDTTCAMVGGIVALQVGENGIPQEWLEAREPLIGHKQI